MGLRCFKRGHLANSDPLTISDEDNLDYKGLSLATPISDQDRAFVAEHITSEQTRLLYRFSVVGYLAELLVVFLLGAILWNEISERPATFAWFVAVFWVMVPRYALYKLFMHKNPPMAELPKWEFWFVIGSLVMAGLWGVIGSVLLPKSVVMQLPVMMLVALLTTGAMAYYAPHKSLFAFAALFTLLPMGVATMGFGDRTSSMLGAAILVFVGALVYVHSRVHKALVDSLTARFDNVLIAMRLKEEKRHVEEAGRLLEQEALDRRRAERAELLAAQRLRLHVERTPLGVVEWDMAFRATTWNPAAEAVFGYNAAEAVGESGYMLVAGVADNERLAQMWMDLIRNKGASRVTLTAKTKRGETIETEWYNTPLVDGENNVIGVASLVQDVTERVNTERTIHYMAHHDALTGLPNRRLMQDRLNQAILQARRQQRHVALMFLDLDRFKLVNDTLGHETGDHVLREVTKRLMACVRDGDTVSREGGDEFIVVLSDLDKPESAQMVAGKIMTELAKPIEVSGHELTVTASIGISHFPNDATDVQQLLKHADSAMYQAKDAGRNTARFFTSDLNFLLSKRLELETRLRRGIERNEFYLRYQPLVNVASGQIEGVEALLRWNDPQKGEIYPADFISVAEELGVIVPLGEWVFRTACQQLAAWEKQGIHDLTMSVNLSPRQFISRKLLPSMREAIDESGVKAMSIDLEITETMAMRNLDQTVEILEELRRMGVSISIDDFGVGYSSLSQLSKLPAQTLKIDKSFISMVPGDENSCSITEAIIAMAKSLKLRIVAEGVEQEVQLAFLRKYGCDLFQGYLYAKPLTSDDATALIRAQRKMS